MNRITEIIARLDRRKLLVPFFTAGYPDLRTSLELVTVAADSGADIVEIGMPFSDPLADGPQIQYSSHLALQNGIDLRTILNSVHELRSKLSIPIVLMGYYNPLIAYGEARFIRDAKQTGVDGLIIPDLPVDEALGYCKLMKHNLLSSIFLVSPTSTDDRIRKINKMSSDFVYAVTVTGVTGTGKKFGHTTDNYLKHLNNVLTKPFVAGFGVSSPESATRLCQYSDGVVIGSALVQLIRKALTKRAAIIQIGRFLGKIRKAI